MNKFKLTTALTTGAIIAAAIAPAAFAEDVTVMGNGAFSNSTVNETTSNTTSVSQSSNTTAVTTVMNSANTGGNSSSFNTGGASSITTGDATNVTEVTVSGGDNTAVVPACGCNTGLTPVTIMGNGAFSKNKVTVKNTNTVGVSQSTTTTAYTTVVNKAKTGKNSSSFNTGGASSITTNGATNGVTVTVSGGSNMLGTGLVLVP